MQDKTYTGELVFTTDSKWAIKYYDQELNLWRVVLLHPIHDALHQKLFSPNERVNFTIINYQNHPDIFDFLEEPFDSSEYYALILNLEELEKKNYIGCGMILFVLVLIYVFCLFYQKKFI